MKWKPRALGGLVLFAQAVFALGSAEPAGAVTYPHVVKVSEGQNSTEANGPSFAGAISADGRMVAFPSHASNLVPGDTNGMMDVFVRDLGDHSIERITLSNSGQELFASSSQTDRIGSVPSISEDGRSVSYMSNIPALTGLPSFNYTNQIFVWDRQAGTTIRASTAGDGTLANGQSTDAKLTADGQWIVFGSAGSNLVPSDTNGQPDVFMKNLGSGAVERVSVDGSGAQANGASVPLDVSPDGRWVLFRSSGSNLVASDTNGATVDVYLRDRQAGTTERFAPTDCATMGLNYTGGAVSDDGRWLALSSIQCTTGTGGKVTLTDRQTGTVTVVNGMDNALDFSADARYLLADNSNLFRYDRLTNTNTVFVPNTEGGTISASGDSVAYQAQDYYSRYPVGPHPGDTNQALDSFVYQFAAEPRDTTPPVISYELSTPPNEAGWHNAPVTLTWTITDLESSPNSPSGCDPATVNVDGAVTYTCSATSEGGTASQSVTINYDSTPPVIDHTLSTPPNANGWHNANVTIDWLASDVGGSGVTAEPTDTVATTEGANVAYTSPEVCDQAGNCATGSAHLSIDTTVPSQSNFAPAGPQLIVVRNRNFTIDATDAPSGVERVEYYFDTDPGLGNGTSATLTTANTYRGVLDTGTSTPLTPHTLFVRTRDEAGNWSTTFSRTFHEIH